MRKVNGAIGGSGRCKMHMDTRRAFFLVWSFHRLLVCHYLAVSCLQYSGEMYNACECYFGSHQADVLLSLHDSRPEHVADGGTNDGLIVIHVDWSATGDGRESEATFIKGRRLEQQQQQNMELFSVDAAVSSCMVDVDWVVLFVVGGNGDERRCESGTGLPCLQWISKKQKLLMKWQG